MRNEVFSSEGILPVPVAARQPLDHQVEVMEAFYEGQDKVLGYVDEVQGEVMKAIIMQHTACCVYADSYCMGTNNVFFASSDHLMRWSDHRANIGIR